MPDDLGVNQQSKTYKDNRDIGCWGAVVLGLASRFILTLVGVIINETILVFLSIVCSVGVLWLAIWGCYNWAKLKNRNGTWALFGVLAPLGFIPLMLLRPRMIRSGSKG